MLELVFLGTAASAPSIQRGLPSQVVLYQDERFVVDCGEGTQRQILRSGLGFRQLNRVLLTHGHLDHILGLGGLVSTFSRWESIATLKMYGGQWALQRVEDLIKVVLRGGEVDMNIDLVAIRPGVIWQDASMRITAFPVSHRGPGCFGYAFEETGRRPFMEAKAEELGVPRGPERRRLVEGETITLPNGRQVSPDDVLGTEVKGIKIVHVGDAGRTDNLIDVCRDADALIIEATYLSRNSEMAARFGHLTAAQAAELAVRANVKHLFLVHISRRYSGREIKHEARAIFANSFVPRDLDTYRITKERVERVE